jgi:Bacterial Ig-like domain
MPQVRCFARSRTKRAVGFAVTLGLLLTFGGGASAGTDVTTGLGGNEPHAAVVNPRNPSQVAVGQFCTVAISNDFGRTFPITRSANPCSGFGGDISLAYDSQGRLFVAYLAQQGADNELTVMAGQVTDTTTLGGGTFNAVAVSADDGGNDDKDWIAADANPDSPYRDNLYITWTDLGASDIKFSRSLNQGGTWSAQQTVSAGGEGFTWPSDVAVGPNGDVYVAYHTDACTGGNGNASGETIQLLRDGSGGANFAAGTVPQKAAAFGPGQGTLTCNVQGSPGAIPGLDFWLMGSGQPFILPDPVRAGNVYVVASDDPNNNFGNGDDADVMIARSSDFGQNFTVGRVDHGPGQTAAVMPTAQIDQNGNIAVHWYDDRRLLQNTGANANFGQPNFLLDMYATTSRDGGQTFTNDFRISDSPFDPDAGPSTCRFGSRATNDCTERIGEYNGIWAVDGIGYGAFTGNTTPPAAPFPSDGSGGQRIMFDVFSLSGQYADSLEPNDSRDPGVATDLGSHPTYSLNGLTINSASDEDFFKVKAAATGSMSLELQYNQRASNLAVQVQDAFGNAVAGVTSSFSNSETAAIPVVATKTYFVRVFAPANQFAPENSYSLSIVNTPAPVPQGLNLTAASDSGRSSNDDVTNDNTPTIRIQLDESALSADGIAFSPTNDSNLANDSPGFKVEVLIDGSAVGIASQVSAGVYEFTPAFGLSDGEHAVTARVVIVDPTDDPSTFATDHNVGRGALSAPLAVTIDTQAPLAPSIDLKASSDTGGIDDDNITTLTAPAFAGAAEANSLVRLHAGLVTSGGSQVVGQAVAAPTGAYEVVSNPLSDGTYGVFVDAEDLAGNVGGVSPTLKVTIANQSLSLPLPTFGAAGGAVAVDLAAGTVSGFPGIPSASGLVGIQGIPHVSLAVNGHALSFAGTPGDDTLTYTPSAADGGGLARAGSSQVIDFTGVSAGGLSIDPLGGSDTVTSMGTAGTDTINATTKAPVSTVQVNSLLALSLKTPGTEVIGIAAGDEADTINVTAFDGLNQVVTVDGASSGSKKHFSDTLNVAPDPAAKPNQVKLRNVAGKTDGSGSVFVTYTGGSETRVDYTDIEQVKLLK